MDMCVASSAPLLPGSGGWGGEGVSQEACGGAVLSRELHANNNIVLATEELVKELKGDVAEGETPPLTVAPPRTGGRSAGRRQQEQQEQREQQEQQERREQQERLNLRLPDGPAGRSASTVHNQSCPALRYAGHIRVQMECGKETTHEYMLARSGLSVRASASRARCLGQMRRRIQEEWAPGCTLGASTPIVRETGPDSGPGWMLCCIFIWFG